MAIIRSNKAARTSAPVTHRPATRRPARTSVTAGTRITAGVQNRRAGNSAITSSVQLTDAQNAFVRQLKVNMKRSATITAATNTSNIMARPDFLELLPMFVQKLHILDLFGSVAMRSRHQIVPYFKFIAENTKGETAAGTILSSPFVNRQGIDPNFTGRVIKGELVSDSEFSVMALVYTPILPGSVNLTVYKGDGSAVTYTDDGAGSIVDGSGATVGYINYSNGGLEFTDTTNFTKVVASYQYDNETVGPNESGEYGAEMAKGYLQLDEFDLKAEALELACYWSIYSAFAAQQEYGSNIADIAKEAAFSEITAEINTKGFKLLEHAATFNPAYNWDASPVLGASVVPSDYLNMFKLKLNQAAASIYQATRLTMPNRLSVGTNVATYIGMISGFKPAPAEDNVGPYKVGTLDKFEIYCCPDYDPDKWVMSCKNNDIRRNSALFGEYMPLINTDAIGLANASVQQGYATMLAMKVVNPATVVSGKIVGTF